MNECHRLGIKNFKSIRYPGQIKLVFDLCDDDPLASRHISTKGEDDYQKIQIPDYNKFKFDYFPIKKSTKDKYFKILINFIINILYFLFRFLCIILKYTIYLIWCLFKIFLYSIFRILTKSKIYYSKDLICHPVPCYHHQHYRF